LGITFSGVGRRTIVVHCAEDLEENRVKKRARMTQPQWEQPQNVKNVTPELVGNAPQEIR
jgi:hypothetical protein